MLKSNQEPSVVASSEMAGSSKRPFEKLGYSTLEVPSRIVEVRR